MSKTMYSCHDNLLRAGAGNRWQRDLEELSVTRCLLTGKKQHKEEKDRLELTSDIFRV